VEKSAEQKKPDLVGAKRRKDDHHKPTNLWGEREAGRCRKSGSKSMGKRDKKRKKEKPRTMIKPTEDVGRGCKTLKGGPRSKRKKT